MQRKIFSRFIKVSVIIFMILALFCIIDFNRFDKDKRPIFSIHTDHVNDGGSTIYYGIGYQLINWKVIDSIEIDKTVYLRGKEKHLLFSMINPIHGPSIELKKMEESNIKKPQVD